MLCATWADSLRHDLFQDALAQVKVAAAQGHAHVAGVKASWRRHDGNAGSVARARLADWCEDSLEVMDGICALEPARAPALRREGMRFFCRMNYLAVPQIASLSERLSGYLLVARSFGFVDHRCRACIKTMCDRICARRSAA